MSSNDRASLSACLLQSVFTRMAVVKALEKISDTKFLRSEIFKLSDLRCPTLGSKSAGRFFTFFCTDPACLKVPRPDWTDTIFTDLSAVCLCRHYPCPPVSPSSKCTPLDTTCLHAPVFIAGKSARLVLSVLRPCQGPLLDNVDFFPSVIRAV